MDDRRREKLLERRRDLLAARRALVDAFRRAPSMDLATFMLGEASAANKEIAAIEKELGPDRIEGEEMSVDYAYIRQAVRPDATRSLYARIEDAVCAARDIHARDEAGEWEAVYYHASRDEHVALWAAGEYRVPEEVIDLLAACGGPDHDGVYRWLRGHLSDGPEMARVSTDDWLHLDDALDRIFVNRDDDKQAGIDEMAGWWRRYAAACDRFAARGDPALELDAELARPGGGQSRDEGGR